MQLDVLNAFNNSRCFSKKSFQSACYAPYTNLYFDQWGIVRACCWGQNYSVGDIRKDTVNEIWHGLRMSQLRSALKNYSFELGCALCEEQLARGWVNSTNMHKFDRYDVTEEAPLWPIKIELSISNLCNLQCIMCNGNFSTAIRTHREKLPPRPPIYPDNFADQLRDFIPHLQLIKFLGGEPFLIREYYQIWDRMIADTSTSICHVTTNGTIFNNKIASVLDKLRFAFAVSLDGATKKTVESIRVGARFEEQLKILGIFREYTKEKHTHLALVYCFMRQNWMELGEFCHLADDWDCDVGINTVNYPPEFGIYNLPTSELVLVLRGMENQAPHLETTLKRNKSVWLNELEKVRSCIQLRGH